MFADPFNTAGLVIDTMMHAGFLFEVYDLYEGPPPGRPRHGLPAQVLGEIAVEKNSTIGFPARAVSRFVGAEVAAPNQWRTNRTTDAAAVSTRRE